MTSAALVSYLKAVLLLGSVLMVLKLYRTGLYRRYPIFFAFFIFRIPNSIWPSFPGERSSPPAPLPRRRTARAALGRCAIVIMGGTDPARAPRLGRVRRYGLPAACCG